MTKTNGRPPSTTLRSLSPISILNTALQKVPALKYALGVAAIAVLAALIMGLLANTRAAPFVLGGIFVGMILLFVFSRLVASQSPAITSAGIVLLWTTILFFCTFLVFVASAVAVGWPKPLARWLGIEQPALISVIPAGPTQLGPKAEIVLFDNWNGDGVESNPRAQVQFTISRDHYITSIANYHFNRGAGAARGNIGLRHHNGTSYGPWQAVTSSGQGGAQSVNWECKPNERIPAGTYTVVDSDVATWSHNEKSGWRGFSLVKGHPAD